MKKNFVLFLILTITIQFILSEDQKKTYFINNLDTLQSIASTYYSKLPNSEPSISENSFRWLLLYNENKDNLDLKILFYEFGWNQIIIIEPNQKIFIPILDNYPTLNELQTMIFDEINTAKFKIKKLNEALEVKDLTIISNNDIEQMTFAKDENEDIEVKEIKYFKKPYKLSDNTSILSTDKKELDLFIRNIIEHPTADKTIIIFPDIHSDYIVGYKKFLEMQKIADINPEKKITVLLESISNAAPVSPV